MKADLAITNGLLVDSRGMYPGVLYIQGEKIVGISRAQEDSPARVIDARGLCILPGAIDGHVHMMDPGYTDRENFTTGTRAAARGGVTTVIDHHRTVPQVFSAGELIAKKDYLEKRAVVDFGLLGGLSLSNLKALRGMWEAGALGFKGFTCELHEADALEGNRMTDILDEIRRFDGIALFHCEDDVLLKGKEKQLRGQGRKDPLTISEWRSPEAEELAVRALINAARKTGARVAVAHTSLPSLVIEQAVARAQGVRIFTETCAQYFYLTEEDLAKQGPFSKFTPPPRKKEDVEKMWWCAAQGLIDMVNSDHCPYPYADKEKGLKDIWQAPFGIPGVETVTPILLDLVSRGLLTLPQVAYLRSERPAIIYGLNGQKGALRVGCDADITLVDLHKKVRFDNARVVSKCGWTPYHGREVTGDVVMTIVRGKVVMEGEKIAGEPGGGRFVTRRREGDQ